MPRGSDRKKQILESFTQLVAERGYDDARFSDIGDELGVSKGTIVHHYGSKLEMLRAMHMDYMERRLAEARGIVAEIERPADQLSAMIYALLLCHRDDRNASLAFTREIIRFAQEPEMNEVRRIRHEYTEVVTDIVRRGIERRDFQDADPELIALQVFGMCNWAWTWYRPEGRQSIEHIASTYSQALLAGISQTRFHNVLEPANGTIPTLVRRLMASSQNRDA